MNTTPNLGLKKPLQTEFYNVDDFNYNSDTIDQAIHDLSENKQNKLSTSQMDAVNSGITSAKVSKLDALPTSAQLDGSLSSKANKSDITNISITGSTNNTGSNIGAGTRFYLNGTLCKALSDIANGATLTNGTNYAETTLNDNLKSYEVITKTYTGALSQGQVITISTDRDYRNALSISILSQYSSSTYISGTVFVDNVSGSLLFYSEVSSATSNIIVRILMPKL